MHNSKTSNSKIPPHMVAWLSAEGWTAEELSFLEEHHEIMGITLDTLSRWEQYRVRVWVSIHSRLEAQKGERAREYDSKNNYQGKDSPEWFRASIDRNLFK